MLLDVIKPFLLTAKHREKAPHDVLAQYNRLKKASEGIVMGRSKFFGFFIVDLHKGKEGQPVYVERNAGYAEHEAVFEGKLYLEESSFTQTKNVTRHGKGGEDSVVKPRIYIDSSEVYKMLDGFEIGASIRITADYPTNTITIELA